MRNCHVFILAVTTSVVGSTAAAQQAAREGLQLRTPSFMYARYASASASVIYGTRARTYRRLRRDDPESQDPVPRAHCRHLHATELEQTERVSGHCLRGCIGKPIPAAVPHTLDHDRPDGAFWDT